MQTEEITVLYVSWGHLAEKTNIENILYKKQYHNSFQALQRRDTSRSLLQNGQIPPKNKKSLVILKEFSSILMSWKYPGYPGYQLFATLPDDDAIIG